MSTLQVMLWFMMGQNAAKELGVMYDLHTQEPEQFKNLVSSNISA